MEMIEIPKENYERMLKELAMLRELKEVDIDLVNQFQNSLEDVKKGQIKRVA
jgi:hypothetical protein